MLPGALTVRVPKWGTVRALMFRVLVAVALSNAVIEPEPIRLTVPPALLVMPVSVPVPLRFNVPVLVKFARAMVIGPPLVLLAVPALARVLMETVPPRLRVPAAPLVKPPVPERRVPTVSVPLLVYVPVILTLAIDVVVVPLNVLPAPENVCVVALEVVNVLALFVKSF